MPQLSPTELGVVAVVLLLIVKELFKFLKDVVIPFFGQSNERMPKETDLYQLRRDATNDIILTQLAGTMEKQTVILQGLERITSVIHKDLKDLKSDFHTHERDMRGHDKK